MCRCTAGPQNGDRREVRRSLLIHPTVPEGSNTKVRDRLKQFGTAGSRTDAHELPCSLFKVKATTAWCMGCTHKGIIIEWFEWEGTFKIT